MIKESVGGSHPQPIRNFSQLNDRSSLCRKCEFAQSDRKYSPKRESVTLTDSLFVVKEGL